MKKIVLIELNTKKIVCLKLSHQNCETYALNFFIRLAVKLQILAVKCGDFLKVHPLL